MARRDRGPRRKPNRTAMITAVDTSVLLAIFNAEPGADQWMVILIRAKAEGRLVISSYLDFAT